MPEAVRLLLTLALAGAAVTFAGSGAAWFMDDQRRIRRALKRVLGAEPQNLLVGHGRGVGFALESQQIAIAWNGGEWCLIYRLSELLGAELMVDGQVAARIYRDEPRRALDQVGAEAARISLRLAFDDPRHPDFVIDLWVFDPRRRSQAPPAETIKAANRWLTALEALLRRSKPRKIADRTAAAPEPEPDEAPPWDGADDDLDR
jgi:hypothetical protein